MNERNTSRQAIDIAIRLLLLFGVLYWSYQILAPFLMPVLWALILAVALYPLQLFLENRFKLKPKGAAFLITFILLALIVVPSYLFLNSLTDVALQWKREMESGSFTLPEPPAFLSTLPFIGDKLQDYLAHYNEYFNEWASTHQETILNYSKYIISGLLGTGLGAIQALVSIVIGGVFLAKGHEKKLSAEVFSKLIGEEGHVYLDLIVNTIRSVVKGVLGVALIQGLLAGIGLFICGVPHAAVWTLICFVLAIVQVGPGLVLAPVAIYLFQTESTLFASIASIYFVGVLISDNLIKPILLGKGAKVPMLVIFIGVIGGFMLSGFSGLFTGAIILSVVYKLFQFWIVPPEIEESSEI
jgi:predicted PurR-regulated permease PerM